MSQEINLYAAHLRPRRQWASARQLVFAVLALAVLVAAAALWADSEARRLTDEAQAASALREGEQARLVEFGKAIAARGVSAELAAEIEAAKAMLAVRQEVLAWFDSGELGNTEGFSAVMKAFARQSSDRLWLTGFRLQQGGAEIEIRGRLFDPAALPAYVQRLNDEAVFRGRRFAALSMKEGSPGAQPAAIEVVDFALRSERIEGESAHPGGRR